MGVYRGRSRSVQGGEGATVRLCDRCDRCDGGIGATGWLSWFYFRFYFLLEQRVRREMREVKWSRAPRVFWKMVYRNFFRKPFSFFSFAFLG